MLKIQRPLAHVPLSIALELNERSNALPVPGRRPSRRRGRWLRWLPWLAELPEQLEALLVGDLKLGGLQVVSLGAHQLIVRAVLHDLAVFEHHDEIGPAQRAQAMRDDERGAPGNRRNPSLRGSRARSRGRWPRWDRRAGAWAARAAPRARSPGVVAALPRGCWPIRSARCRILWAAP